MLQIKNTLGGGKPEGLYAWKKSEIGSELKEFNKSVSTLPYSFYGGSAVMLNGEIHILGGANSTTNHYKWDGTNWTSVSTLPYNFVNGSAVVLNGEIHILGSNYSTSYYKYHYKWNGSSWISVSTLPYDFYNGAAVVLNNEIHILGGSSNGSYRTNHYKWDGTSWTSVSTLPYQFRGGSVVVFDNEIHILGSSSSSATYKYHYKWDGTSWTSVSSLPYIFYQGSAVVFNGEIHILGCGDTSYFTKHYKWDGTSWTSVSTLPYGFYQGSAVVFDNTIHILGSHDSNYRTAHYLVYGYVTTYTFLGYVVSDKETAYPDGGEKGGYWYEKVVEGIDLSALGMTKCETGSFTLASDYYTVTFNHTLGIKPKAVIVNEHAAVTRSKIINTYLASGTRSAYTYNARADSAVSMNNTLDISTVKIGADNTNYKFKGGVEYHYALFA